MYGITKLRNRDFVDQCNRIHLKSVMAGEDLTSAEIAERALKCSPKRYYVETDTAVEVLNAMLSSKKPAKVNGMNHRQMMYYEILTRMKKLGAIKNGRVKRPWLHYVIHRLQPSWFFMSAEYATAVYRNQRKIDEEEFRRELARRRSLRNALKTGER